MRRIHTGLACLLVLAAAARAGVESPETALESARREARTVLLLVHDATAPGMDGAREFLRRSAALVPSSRAVELDRGSAANAGVVASLRIATVPVPVVLVVAPNGVIVGGAVPGRVSPEQVAALVPSPKKAEYFRLLGEKRAVFLLVARSDMPGLPAARAACDGADARLNAEAEAAVQVGEVKPPDQAETLLVDVADPAERAFLAEMQVDPAASAPRVYAVNPRGQTTAVLDGEQITADALVAAARATVTPKCTDPSCGPNCRHGAKPSR